MQRAPLIAAAAAVLAVSLALWLAPGHSIMAAAPAPPPTPHQAAAPAQPPGTLPVANGPDYGAPTPAPLFNDPPDPIAPALITPPPPAGFHMNAEDMEFYRLHGPKHWVVRSGNTLRGYHLDPNYNAVPD